MTMQQLAIPNCAPATLTLAEPLNLEAIGQLEDGIDALLCKLRHELRGDQPYHVEREVESWTANMRATKVTS